MIIAAIDVDPQKAFTPLLPITGGDIIGAELNAPSQLATYRILTKDAHPTNAIWMVR